MKLLSQQNAIFEELRSRNPEIIDDGVSDEIQYMIAARRIMYVLKEANGGLGWSLCEHLKNGGRNREHDATWDNIARRTEGILSLPADIPWAQSEEGCQQRRKKVLPKICAVNVKKTPGGSVSDNRKVYSAAQDNADLLKRQLDLYKPDIVICCGTEAAFVDACFYDKGIQWRMTTRGIWYFRDGNTVVIAFSHPAARTRDCYLYYALLDAVREILKNVMC